MCPKITEHINSMDLQCRKIARAIGPDGQVELQISDHFITQKCRNVLIINTLQV